MCVAAQCIALWEHCGEWFIKKEILRGIIITYTLLKNKAHEKKVLFDQAVNSTKACELEARSTFTSELQIEDARWIRNFSLILNYLFLMSHNIGSFAQILIKLNTSFVYSFLLDISHERWKTV